MKGLNSTRRWIPAVLLALALSARAQTPDPIQTDINALLESLGHRGNFNERIDRVVQHGTNAVPLLVETYSRTAPEKRWALVDCLIQISTPASLDAVKGILRRHEERLSTIYAIQRFPIDREDEITPVLVDLLEVKDVASDAEERLTKMIFRKPARAGELVNAMRATDQAMVGPNLHIGEVLANVSGFSHTWCCFDSGGTDWGTFQRQFWSDWWNRNHDKAPFDWLVETLQSDPDNDSRKAEALQVLFTLNDPRAAPHFVKALDDDSEGVQYWAVAGLQRLAGAWPPEGISGEQFRTNRAEIVSQLKQKFPSASR